MKLSQHILGYVFRDIATGTIRRVTYGYKGKPGTIRLTFTDNPPDSPPVYRDYDLDRLGKIETMEQLIEYALEETTLGLLAGSLPAEECNDQVPF